MRRLLQSLLSWRMTNCLTVKETVQKQLYALVVFELAVLNIKEEKR